MRPYVAVVGPGDAESPVAEVVGAGLARLGCVLVCGGLGGVMAAACRGATNAGGTTLGLLPGDDRGAGNPWLTVAVATGLGELRNGLVVRASDLVVAIGEGPGTLSEIGFALKLARPVIGVGTFDIAAIEAAVDADDAVARVSAHIRRTSVAH